MASMRGRSPFHCGRYKTLQSSKRARILTNSKPCVQAYKKLCRGEFSASPRVSTFLSVVCCYQAFVRHVSGASILQSDFVSRNASPVTTRPVRCVPSLLELWTLSFKWCLFMISFKAMSAFHSPTDPPGWLFRPNAQIYATHTHTLPTVRDRPKNLRTSRMSNIIYKLRQLLMMASLLCNVMSPCQLPESVSLSHARLWMAF